MKLSIQIETNDDAVAVGGALEVARMVQGVADKIAGSNAGSGPIFDANGNRVGHWSLALGDDESED